MPSAPVTELAAHAAAVNGVQWAPHSSCHICTGGDDSQALIWDLSPIPKPIEGTRSAGRERITVTALFVDVARCRCEGVTPTVLTLVGLWLLLHCMITDPILTYTAEGEINQLRWSAAQPDWVAIAYDNSMQILRV